MTKLKYMKCSLEYLTSFIEKFESSTSRHFDFETHARRLTQEAQHSYSQPQASHIKTSIDNRSQRAGVSLSKHLGEIWDTSGWDLGYIWVGSGIYLGGIWVRSGIYLVRSVMYQPQHSRPWVPRGKILSLVPHYQKKHSLEWSMLELVPEVKIQLS